MTTINVDKSAGQTATVRLYGTDYKVTLGDDNKASLRLYGQDYEIVGKAKKAKAKKVKDAEAQITS